MQCILLVLLLVPVNYVLPDDVLMMVSYTGKKLSICFYVKDKTDFDHKHDIVYYPSVQRNLVRMFMVGTLTPIFLNTV